MLANKGWETKSARGEKTPEIAGMSLDDDLVRIGQHRDRAAFRRVFDHFAPRLKTYLRNLNATDDTAEDLVQDVMVTVWRRAPQFDPTKAAASTWIYTIARNRRIDLYRRKKQDDVEFEEKHETGTAPSGFDFLAGRQMRETINEVIDSLPDKQSELLRVFYFEDKTHTEIADEMGLPLGTVKSRLRLAMVKLRDLLEGKEI